MTRMPLKRSLLLVTAALGTVAARAEAAPEWVDRGITLPQYGLALDTGVGIAHAEPGDFTGVGLNLEGAFGITRNFEIGLRTGVRFSDDAKATHADEYGRLFDTETYDTGGDIFANPELLVRGRLVNLGVLELGLEGRVYIPAAHATDFGVMLGVPLAFHLGHLVRIDTGAYVPVVFSDPVESLVSIPGQFWIQPTRHFFLGPILDLRFHSAAPPPAPVREETTLLLGFGFGYSFGPFADLKVQFLFPNIATGTEPVGNFGAGVGLGLHF
jgi:hypothetical protein